MSKVIAIFFLKSCRKSENITRKLVKNRITMKIHRSNFLKIKYHLQHFYSSNWCWSRSYFNIGGNQAVENKTGISPQHKTIRHKKSLDQIGAFSMHVDRHNNRIFDTRIFSPLLGRLSKNGVLRGYGFCVGNRISDGLARQGLSVTDSKESSGTESA